MFSYIELTLLLLLLCSIPRMGIDECFQLPDFGQYVYRTGIFSSFDKSKLISLGFLAISLIGTKGKKDTKLNYCKTAVAYLLTGLLIYLLSCLTLLLKIKITEQAIVYIAITSIGFLLVLSGGTLVSRIIKKRLNNKDVFNKVNETFPQDERLLQNEFSINLPGQYHLKKRCGKAG